MVPTPIPAPATVGQSVAIGKTLAAQVARAGVADALDARGVVGLLAAGKLTVGGGRAAVRALVLSPPVPAPRAITQAVARLHSLAPGVSRAGIAHALVACDDARLIAAVVVAVGIRRARKHRAFVVRAPVPAPLAIAQAVARLLALAPGVSRAGVAQALDASDVRLVARA